MLVTTNFVSSFGRLVSRMSGGKLENVEYKITGKMLLEKGVMRRIPFAHRARSISRRRATSSRPSADA